MEKNIIVSILGITVAILVGVFVYFYQATGGDLFGGIGRMSKDEVGEFTINFIKENFASPDAEMELLGVEEKNGVYEIKFKWTGQDQTAYVTKDTKYLFPQAFDMRPPGPQEFSKTEKPEVGLFVMSFCPFGNQAEELMIPIVELLGNTVDIKLHYIVSKGQENEFSSLHGDQELNQGIREICVQKYQRDKFWNFVEAINIGADYENVDAKWENIARDVGINVEQIKTCQEQEGNALLTEELALTDKNYPVQDPSKLPPPSTGQEEIRPSGSPALVINGMIYTGDRSTNGYKEAICSAFIEPPIECEEELTEPVPASGGSCE